MYPTFFRFFQKHFVGFEQSTRLFYKYLRGSKQVERSFDNLLNVKDLSETVEALSKKTDALIQALNASRQKVSQLESNNLDLKGKVTQMNESFDKLKEENKVLKMAAAIKGDEEVVSETKRKISQMVREIDRCIAKLND